MQLAILLDYAQIDQHSNQIGMYVLIIYIIQ